MSLVMTIASFCSILGLLAVSDQGLPRFFIDTKEEIEKKRYVTTSFFISGIGVLSVVLIIICSTPVVPIVIKDIKAAFIFTLLVAFLCLSQSLLYVGNNMLKWTFRSSLFTKITIIQTLIGAALTIGGIIFWGWGAKEVLITGGLVAFGAGIFAIFSVKEYIKPSMISKKKLKELIAYSWPLLGLNIFSFFTRSLDRIFLSALTSLRDVGIFSVSYSIASLFGTLISGLFFAWGPYVLSTFRETWAPQRYAQFFSIVSCFGILSIIVLGLWSGPVVLLFRPDGAYKEIGIYIPWIVSGILIFNLGGYFTPGPSIKKKTYWKLPSFILSGICNAILNYILIPRLGILGAGVATAISCLLASIFNQFISNKLYFVPNRWVFSFGMIFIFTTIVSLLQHDSFIYNINKISLPLRCFITITLLIIGIIPFYKDIRDSGFLQKINGILLKKGPASF